MIYEMRVYEAVPGRLPDIIKRFETKTLKHLAEARHQAGRLLHDPGR